ncbi:MAG: 4-hydroxythreonine-4-phosphate dehydrogenase PdxA [Desulfonatronovibrionaceae bacterium]
MSFILYTLGDPAGLGPELIFRAGLENISRKHPVLPIGPENILLKYSTRLEIPAFWKKISHPAAPGCRSPGFYLYEPPSLRSLSFQPGRPSVSGGMAAGTSLREACRIMQAGLGHALVTGPLNKSLVLEAGFPFGGHTEFLADFFQTGPENVCMHLCGERLRVSLVTTHPPLAEVSRLVTREKIINCLRLTQDLMHQIGLDQPLAVCGLNPHAGEQGKIGDEEKKIIEPAINQAREAGIKVCGPLSADTVFWRACQGEFSAVLAMYHDQGLGPLKVMEFGRSVNITLGLPIIRTSVDHGTGYDLAGTGRASPVSLKRAFELALMLHKKRSQQS